MRLPALSSLLLVALLPLGAQAKTTDRQAPMDIDAGHTDALLTDNGDTVLSDGVVIIQGTLDVRSDNSPATLKQVNDNGEAMNARASQIVYTLSSDIVVLTGGVVIEQPRGTLRGESVKYDLKTGRLDGGGDGKRVQMRILPKTAGAK